MVIACTVVTRLVQLQHIDLFPWFVSPDHHHEQRATFLPRGVHGHCPIDTEGLHGESSFASLRCRESDPSDLDMDRIHRDTPNEPKRTRKMFIIPKKYPNGSKWNLAKGQAGLASSGAAPGNCQFSLKQKKHGLCLFTYGSWIGQAWAE